MRRPKEALEWKVVQMEDWLTKRGKGRPKKTLGETIKKHFDSNGFGENLAFDRA